LRKLASTALAVPVLALLYLSLLARRSVAARIALLATVGVVVVVAGFGLSRPIPTTATAPAPPITALAADQFRAIDAATELRAPVTIRFSEPMNRKSVAASLQIVPAATADLEWNETSTELAVRPASHWAAGVYHTITVDAGALAATGRPMAATVRAAFVTRPATSGRIEATKAAKDGTSIATAFRITLDRPVDRAALDAVLRIDPPVEGSLTVTDGAEAGDSSTAATTFTFTPTSRLAPATTYRVTAPGLVDGDGSSASIGTLEVTTSAAPRVIRFRPADGATKVARRTAISVRFSESMTHATTRSAFRVTAAGKPVAGTYRFAEASKVLVFQPRKALPAGAAIVATVDATATSLSGVPLGKSFDVKFKTAPVAKKVVARTSAPRVVATAPPSGGSVGGGSWGAVERYYLKLMNCTRTGGWVTSTGGCSSPGGRSVAPLWIDAGISSKVSRPYAKKLAVNNLCTHFSGGTPGDRLRRAGYTSYIWAENLGCRSGNPASAVLGSHLYFQSEKPYLGGHYVNLMNAKYDRVGIGVWVAGGRVRLVVDFYHPR
jgi:uncharacterized protein YkwD